MNEKEEEAAGISSVLGNAEVAGIVLGNQTDKMRMKKIFRETASVDSLIRAGNIFTRDSLTEAGNIFLDVEGYSIVDPEKVTRGGLKMFRYSEDVVFVKENGDKVYGGPVGEERSTINQRFDVMFWELKETGILCWRDTEKDINMYSLLIFQIYGKISVLVNLNPAEYPNLRKNLLSFFLKSRNQDSENRN